MKQIFTFLMLAIFSGVFSASAETVTCTVYDWDWKVVADDFEAELTVDSDGVYTLTPFMNSGSPVMFTLGEFSAPDSDNIAYADMAFENVSVEEGYVYLLDSDGDYMSCEVFSGNSSYTLDWPYVFEDGYSSVSHYVDYKEHEGWKEFDGLICLNGWSSKTNGWGNGYYIYFLFDDLSSSGISQEIVNEDAPVEYFNLQGVKIANPENGIFIRRQGKEVKKVYIK